MVWREWENTPTTLPIDFENVEVIDENEYNIGCRFEGQQDDNITWVPKSVIHKESEVSTAGQTGTLSVFHWYAESEGLI